MKKIIFLGTVIFFLFVISSVGQAAVTVTATKLPEEDANYGILPKSGKTGIFKIKLSGGTGVETFTSCSVTFVNQSSSPGNFNAAADLLNMSASYTYTSGDAHTYGLTLYKNDTDPEAEKIFDESDDPEPCTVAGTGNGPYTLTLTTPLTLAASTDYYFYIVIKTSDDIQSVYYGSTDHRDKFSAISGNAVVGGIGQGAGVETDVITCESRVVDLIPMRSDTNSLTNANNTYYPGDYPGDSTHRYRWFIPEEREEPNADYYYEMAISELASSDTYIAVLGLDVAAPRGCYTIGYWSNNNEYLTDVTITVTGSGTFDPDDDLEGLDGDSIDSGVTFWKDDGDGIFEPSADTRLNVSYVGWTETVPDTTWTLKIDPDDNQLIDPTVDSPAVVDYFVVIRTTMVNHGLDFKVSLEPGDVNFLSDADPDVGLSRTAADCKSINTTLQMHDYVASGEKIDATSSPIPVLGINVTDGNGYTEKIHSVKITFSGTGFAPADLAVLCDGLSSGVSLWKDNKEEGHLGTFDPSRSRKDTLVPIHAPVWNGNTITIYPRTALDVADDDWYTGSNRGDDYFICVRTSDTIDYTDTIEAEIEVGDIQFKGATSSIGSPNSPPHPYPLTANVNVSLTNLIPEERNVVAGERIECIRIYVKKPTAAVSLASLVCQIVDRDDVTFGLGDLMPLVITPGNSGIAIYKDIGGTLTGLLLSSITLIGDPLYDAGFDRVELVLNVADVITTPGNTYYLIIRTNKDLKLTQEDFSIRLWGSDIDVTPNSGKALGFADGTRSYEKLETSILGPMPPAGLEKPTFLQAIPAVNVITLRWDDNSTGESGFQIERKIAGTNDSNYEIIATVGDGTGGFAEYTDYIGSGEIDDTHTYRVRAYTSTEIEGGYEYEYSFWSDEASAASYTFSYIIGEGGGGTGCFIATAAFGTPMAEEVRTLCKFRDNVLLKTTPGKDFVKLYYALSPPIADFIRNKPLLKAVVRIGLKPLVWWSRFLLSQE